MERDRMGIWVGEVHFVPAGHPVQISTEGAPDNIPDWAEECFRTLATRFLDLSSTIWEVMFERYMEHELPAGCPSPGSPEEMSTLVVIEDIHLKGPHSLTLGYGFRDGLGWDDLMFTVGIDEWTVTECWTDD